METRAVGVVVVSERWHALSASARRWLVIGAVVLTIVVVIQGLNALGTAPGGPTLSSYATDGAGLAAYEELLATTGHATSRLRQPLDKQTQTPNVTLIAIGQTFSHREASALIRFLGGGGRVIVGNPEAEDALIAAGVDDVYWSGRGATVVRPTGTAPLDGVRVVRGQGFGEWQGDARAVLAKGSHVTAISVAVGKGELLALADPSPITNAWLGVADNAAFAVAIAGPADRPVVFAEYGHGFGVRNGLGAIPSRWKAALWFAAVAAVVGALSSAKRFGPPEPTPETVTPARVLYVESLASTLARTRDYEAAMTPLKRRAKALIARRSGGVNLDDTADLARAALAAGLAPDDVATLTAAAGSDLDVLALGRVVAKLEES